MKTNFISVLLIFLIVSLSGCMIAIGISAFNEIKGNNPAKDLETSFSSSIEKKEDVETPQIVEGAIDSGNNDFASNISYQSSQSQKRYFYNQLDSVSKTIYDGLVASIDNMKSGTYKVEFGDAFDSILSGEGGQAELGNYYQSAVEAFTYDNPEVFYLDPTKMFLNIQTTTKVFKKTYNVYISNKEGDNYLSKGFYSFEQISQCQRQIEQEKNNIISRLSSNAYDKIKQIHDYLVDSINYDQTTSRTNTYNLYGALVEKECVCEGYAKALKYLLNEAGINSVVVLGTGTNSNGQTENHAWNYVSINGNWYAIDATWDDPVIQGGGINIPAMYKYKYFMKGSYTINSDHIPNGQFTDGGKVFTYPSLSASDYD